MRGIVHHTLRYLNLEIPMFNFNLVNNDKKFSRTTFCYPVCILAKDISTYV